MSTAVAVSVLGLAAILVPDHGLDGGATAWFAGNAVAAVVAAGMFARLRLVVRPRVAVAAHEGVGERRGEPVP
jgi:O-antigen/teichoic acid export membrane protein